MKTPNEVTGLARLYAQCPVDCRVGGAKLKPIRIAETVEQAIEIVSNEHTECQLKRYSHGMTREQFLEYLEREGINPKALGVFISGRFVPPWIGRLTFMPDDWIHDSAQFH